MMLSSTLLSFLALYALFALAQQKQPEFVIAGASPYPLASSSDGTAWGTDSSSYEIFFTATDVAFAPNTSTWVAVGQKSSKQSARLIAYSYDGVTWTPASAGPFSGFNTELNGVAYSPTQNLWISVGFITACGTAIASSDGGKTWGSCSTATGGVAQGIAFSVSQNRWVAVGGSPGEIAYSNNGTFWTQVTGIMNTVNDVAFSERQQRWVAVGIGGFRNGWPDHFVSTMAYSADGITWTKVSYTSFVADNGYCVRYSNRLDLWVAVGAYLNWTSPATLGGIISYSKTGTSAWTTVLNHPFTGGSYEIKAVAYSESLRLWMIGASNVLTPITIATSPSGTGNWTTQPLFTTSFNFGSIGVSDGAFVSTTTTTTTSTTTRPSNAPMASAYSVLVLILFFALLCS